MELLPSGRDPTEMELLPSGRDPILYEVIESKALQAFIVTTYFLIIT